LYNDNGLKVASSNVTWLPAFQTDILPDFPQFLQTSAGMILGHDHLPPHPKLLIESHPHVSFIAI